MGQAEGKFQERPKEAHGKGHGEVFPGLTMHSSFLVHTDAGVGEGPVKAFGVEPAQFWSCVNLPK